MPMRDSVPHAPDWHPGSETTGFPSPAQIWREKALCLDDLLLSHPETTFFVRMRGQALREAGILEQDLLLVDRAVPATSGALILAQFPTGFSVKRLLIQEGRTLLHSAVPGAPPIEGSSDQDFVIWGVVLYVLRAVHPLSQRRVGKHMTSDQQGTPGQER